MGWRKGGFAPCAGIRNAKTLDTSTDSDRDDKCYDDDYYHEDHDDNDYDDDDGDDDKVEDTYEKKKARDDAFERPTGVHHRAPILLPGQLFLCSVFFAFVLWLSADKSNIIGQIQKSVVLCCFMSHSCLLHH